MSKKIAIAASGATLNDQVDSRFGRCPYFLIVDSKTEEFEALENTAGQTFRGAGISAAQMIADKKVVAVIAGNFGPKAVGVLADSGIKIFSGVSGTTTKKALEQYKKGELKEAAVANTPMGMGLGRGMGRSKCQDGGKGW